MMKQAELLLYEYRVRFRSVVTGRIYSVAFFSNEYQFAQLDGDRAKPDVVKVLYIGNSEAELIRCVEREVCDG